jgi:hypothetical protein
MMRDAGALFRSLVRARTHALALMLHVFVVLMRLTRRTRTTTALSTRKRSELGCSELPSRKDC